MSMFSDGPLKREVPDLIGLDYQAATALERHAKVHIADPDPDAPPISNYWWEHQHLVVRHQDPPAGAWVDRYGSIRVTLAEPDQPEMARVAPQTPPPVLNVEASPDPDASTD